MPILGGTGSASEYAYRSYLVDYPDPFDWPDQLNVDPGKIYAAGYAKITGIKTKLKLRVSVGSSYSLYENVFDNNQTVTFDSTKAFFDSSSNPNERFKPGLGLNNPAYELIGNNQSVNLSVNTPRVVTTDFSKTYTTNVSIGNSVQDWIVRTRAFDGTPNSFSFTSIGSTTVSTQVFSNTITLAGIETGFGVGVGLTASSAPGTALINGTPYPLNTFEFFPNTIPRVINGDTIQLRTTSPNSFNTNKTLTLRVGTFSTTWSVTTEQENLNILFSSDFTDQSNLNLSTDTDSNQITLTGFSFGSFLPVTLSNTSASYEIERGAAIVKNFTDPAANVTNNDKIKVRLPSSASYSTTVSTTVSVGNSSADWNLTTRSAPPVTPPEPPINPPDPPPPPPSTATVTRYYNSTIADHLYTTGSPITSGSVTVTDTTNAGGSISLSGNQNVFAGESTAGVVRLASGLGSRVRITVPYAMTSVSLIDRTASGGLANAIASASFTSVRTDSCQEYNVTFTRTAAAGGGGGNARNWRINYGFNGYTSEGSFKVFTSPQTGTQLLRTLYNNTRTNHETAFSGDEEATGYDAVQNLGYAYPGSITQPSNTQALYKFVNRSTAAATVGQQYDTLLTTSSSERPSGWTEIRPASGRPYAWVPV